MKFRSAILVLTFLVSLTGFSQTVKDLDSTTIALAVDIANISQEITSSKQLISKVNDKQQYKNTLSALDSSFTYQKQQVDSLFEIISTTDLGNAEKSAIKSYILLWDMYENKINNQYKSTNALVQESTEHLKQLDKNAKIWNATLEVLRADDAPVDLRSNALETANALSSSREVLQVFVSDLVNLENKILDLSTLISEGNDLLLIGMEEQSQNTFVRNAPVLWKIHTQDSLEIEDQEMIPDSIKIGFGEIVAKSFGDEKLKVMESFLENSLHTIYLHLLVTFIALFFIFQLRNADTQPFKNKETFKANAALIIRKNLIASTFFISITVAVVRYSFIPSVIASVLVILLILLLTHILKNSPYFKVTRLALIMASLYVVGQFNPTVFLGEVSTRYFLIIKTLITFSLLAYAMKNFKQKLDKTDVTTWEFTFKIAYLLYLVLLVSIVSNIFGYVKLSVISTLLVIHLGVISFLFFGILLIGNGLIALVFNSAWEPKKESSFEYRESVEKIAIFFLTATAILLWFRSILTSSGVYHSILDEILTFYVTPFSIGSISLSFAEIGTAIIVVIITFSITKFVGIIINEGALDRFKLKRGVPNAISLVIRYSLIVLGIILALSAAGIDLSSLSIMAGALGIGIGFGLQNIISNFVSGLILVFERPLQEGDVVEVNNLLGVVNKIGVRSSNIRTYSGSEVVVPNESLISKQLINWTLSDQRKRIEINIGVEYGSNPREIIEILKTAASSYSEVMKDPAPQVYFSDFGSSSLDFRLLFWVHQSVGLSSKSEVMLAISDAFIENNITIPFPVTTVRMDNSEKTEKAAKNTTADQRADSNLE